MKFLTSIDLSQNEIQNAIMQPLAAPPANPKIGQIYFNSIDLTLYLWTGEKWIPVPTKTSQLENDSGFITSGDIPEGAAASTTTPKMNGTAAVGTEMAFARGDHVHPKDTSKLNTDGDGSNVTVAFEAAAKREAPVSGEKLSVLLGKVLKFFSDLKTVAFSGSYKDLSDKPTIPSAAADVGAIPATEKGAAGGVAELDSGGKVPANQLPSYVDDVVDAYIRTGATALGADWLSKTSGGAAAGAGRPTPSSATTSPSARLRAPPTAATAARRHTTTARAPTLPPTPRRTSRATGTRRTAIVTPSSRTSLRSRRPSPRPSRPSVTRRARASPSPATSSA